MNYDVAIQEIIDVIKADKSVVQPWRNKACSRLEEVQAFVRMGKTTSYREVDLEAYGVKPGINHLEVICTCPDPAYAKRANCPVHGEMAA